MAVSTTEEQDRGALLANAGQFFISGGMIGSFAARAPQICDQIDVSLEEFGVLLAVVAAISMVASVLAGRIVHAVTTRRLLLFGTGTMIASMALIGGGQLPIVWLIGMAIFFFTYVLVDISMNLQSSWISARRATPVMNRVHGVWGLGMFTGGIGAAFANAAGLSPLSHLLIVMVVATALLAMAVPNLLEVDEDGHADSEDSNDSTSPVGSVNYGPMLLILLAGFFGVATQVTPNDWGTFRMTDDFDASATIGSVAFTVHLLGVTAMRLGADSLIPKIGKDGLFRLSLVLAAVGLLIATLVPNKFVSIAGLFIIGVGVAATMPKLYDDAARLPGRRGAGLGAMTFGGRLGLLVTPVVVGPLADTSLSVGQAMLFFAMPAIICLAVVSELTPSR